MSITTVGDIMGTCTNKTQLYSNSTSPAQIYKMQVLNLANYANYEQYKHNDAAHLQQNFIYALFNAYEQSYKHKGMKVYVLLETGSHYILPVQMALYLNQAILQPFVDFVNPELDLVVMPLNCSTVFEMGMTYQSGSCLNDLNPNSTMPSDVYLYNSAGNAFNMQIPSSLYWSGITFDGLNSLIQNKYVTTTGSLCYWNNP